MIDFDDKRNFYRMMLNSEVEVTVIDAEANSQFTATCRDLSASGMAIEIPHPLALGTQVQVKVKSATNNVQSLDTKGKVVRVDEQSSDCYLIGVLIEEID